MKRFDFDTVGTTMDEARKLSSVVDPPFVVVAERQTGGRGRQGKAWLSVDGAYLGTFCLPKKRGDLSGLSLAIGVGIIQGLKIKEAKLKWPNDIYLGGRKCAGILIEVQDKSVLVGIGININSAPDGFAKLDNLSLNSVNKDLDEIVPEICEVFMMKGFGPWKETFNGLDFLKDKSLRAGEIKGMGTGVDDSGAYLIDVTKRVIAGSIEFDVSS